LFVAVAASGTGNRVMTSPDGIYWTLGTSAADNQWMSVTYGNGLFVAVSYSGPGNRVMTSPDGINWTLGTSDVNNQWVSVTYGNGMFVAISNTGIQNSVMTSPYTSNPISNPNPNPNPNPISNICFLAGTPVTTDQGIIEIEKINPKIHTIRKNEIVAITKTVTQDKYLVCFEKDSIGKNIPSQKTVISRNHKLFYKGNMMRAKDFVNDFENVRQIKYSGEILYNVLLKEHNKMMVNNLICETLHPENSVAKLYKVLETLTLEKQNKLIEKVNEYVVKNKCYSSKK
jgi:hypothetical protein